MKSPRRGKCSRALSAREYSQGSASCLVPARIARSVSVADARESGRVCRCAERYVVGSKKRGVESQDLTRLMRADVGHSHRRCVRKLPFIGEVPLLLPRIPQVCRDPVCRGQVVCTGRDSSHIRRDAGRGFSANRPRIERRGGSWVLQRIAG